MKIVAKSFHERRSHSIKAWERGRCPYECTSRSPPKLVGQTCPRSTTTDVLQMLCFEGSPVIRWPTVGLRRWKHPISRSPLILSPPFCLSSAKVPVGYPRLSHCRGALLWTRLLRASRCVLALLHTALAPQPLVRERRSPRLTPGDFLVCSSFLIGLRCLLPVNRRAD